MKKITFIFAFFTAALQAQVFPSPYCAITDSEDVSVEEITAVNFNTISVNNANSTDVLVDLTSTQIPIAPGGTYSLKVYGNTYGNFETSIVAFIDWNNNGTLNDNGEVYELGNLVNSDGTDGIFASMDIVVPATVAEGLKRIRITKTYTDEESVAIVNPCAISFDAFGFGEYPGFGQALDFNLNVSNLSSTEFDAKSLSIYPVPAKNSLTIAYSSPIGSLQIYNQLGQQVYESRNADSEVHLDISDYASGIYFIKLFNDKEAKTFKISKE